jgi:hypothetical protein
VQPLPGGLRCHADLRLPSATRWNRLHQRELLGVAQRRSRAGLRLPLSLGLPCRRRRPSPVATSISVCSDTAVRRPAQIGETSGSARNTAKSSHENGCLLLVRGPSHRWLRVGFQHP